MACIFRNSISVFREGRRNGKKTTHYEGGNPSLAQNRFLNAMIYHIAYKLNICPHPIFKCDT